MADTGNGATLTNATESWTSACVTIGAMTTSIPALDSSDLSTTTYAKKTRGDLVDIGPIECTLIWDQDTRPPLPGVSASSEWILTFPGSQTVSGTGFLTEVSGAELANNQVQIGSFTLQFDGQTGPAYSV